MHSNRRAGLAFALLSIALAACSSPPKLQAPPLTFGGINGGGINAVVRGADGTTYLGGDFTSVSISSGGGLALDGASGQAKGPFPRAEGEIKAAIPDGKGGWYVGGIFRSVGGVTRKNLAHLSSDSKVDTAWAPEVDGPVYALALQGEMVLVGGDFHQVGAVSRRNLAAIDVSGTPSAWNPAASHTGTDEVSAVYALAVSGSSIYVGGDFSIIGATRPTGHSNLAVVDTTGNPLAEWVADMDEPVRALLVTATKLYVGGQFTRVLLADTSAVSRAGLASFTLVDGKLDTSWNPGLVSVDSGSPEVYALAAIGDALYVGGRFKGFASGGGEGGTGGGGGGGTGGGGGGGATTATVLRSSLAALDASGKVLPLWDPALSFGGDVNPEVYALAASGNTLYVGGRFTLVGGQSRSFGAAVDGTSGVPAGWNPGFDGSVEALATRGDAVFAGGSFLGVYSTTRNHLAAIAADGSLTDWNPGIPSGYVYALAVDGDTIYVGGNFQMIGGLGRVNIAAIDKKGVVTAWNPGATNSVSLGQPYVYAIAVGPDAIYVGGGFDTVGTETRTNLASIDRSGQVTAWNPADLKGFIAGLFVSGGHVFCSGGIDALVTTYGLVHYPSSSATDASPSSTADWTLPLTLSSAWAFQLVSTTKSDGAGGSKPAEVLLVGGAFDQIGASGPANLAAIDLETHDVSTAIPLPAVDGSITAIAIADGKVYLAGSFSHVTASGSTDPQVRKRLGAFDLATGALTSWQPDLYAPYDYFWLGGLAPVPGGIDVVGSFTSVDSKIGSGLSRVSR